MSGEQGFAYESQIVRKLKRAGLAPSNFHSAGNDIAAPDAVFKRHDKLWNLEIKYSLNAAFGQGTIHYDVDYGKWKLGQAKDTVWSNRMNAATQQIFKQLNVEKIVNDAWGK